MRRAVAALLAAAVLATTLMLTQTPAAAAACPQQTAPTGLVRQAHPVVLVHGWTGKPLSDTRTALEREMGEGWQFLLFDYHRASAQWAAAPDVAECLATFVLQVSEAHRTAGGDGLVSLVTHSMGGLAVRFAVDPAYGKQKGLADRIGGLVTLATPHQGSPWGNAGVYTQLTDLKNRELMKTLPPGDTPASTCLAPHTAGRGLPKGCAAPPYLPTAIPVHQVEGAVTLERTFFGIKGYDIALGGDSIVPSSSAFGYLGSAPGVPKGQRVGTTSVPCRRDARALLAEAGVPSLLSVLAQLRVDGAAMDAVAAGRPSAALLELLLIANVTMPCSHVGITTSPAAIAAAAEGLRATSAAGLTPAHLQNAPVPSLCDHPAGRLVDGILPGIAPQDGMVELVESQFADLDEDGREEGIATLRCTYGGNADYLGIHVYGRGPTHLDRADLEGSRQILRSRGISLPHATVVEGLLEVRGMDGDEDDATCCPTVYLAKRFSLRDGKLLLQPGTPPTGDDPFTVDGWGSLIVGDDYWTAARKTGWALGTDDYYADEPEFAGTCVYVNPVEAPNGMGAMGGDGKLASIRAFEPGVRTRKGVGVGSTEAEVLAAYGGAVERVPNEYVDIDDVVIDPGKGRVLRFEFDPDTRRVLTMHAGEAGFAMLIEGCA